MLRKRSLTLDKDIFRFAFSYGFCEGGVKMESFSQNASLFWLCVTALFAFLELFFLRYRLLWFSVGGTGGLLCSLFSMPLWVQISVFSLLSGGFLWLCRNWVRRARCEDVLTEIEDHPPSEPPCAIQALTFDSYYDSSVSTVSPDLRSETSNLSEVTFE